MEAYVINGGRTSEAAGSRAGMLVLLGLVCLASISRSLLPYTRSLFFCF